jgi:hypothetical protein
MIHRIMQTRLLNLQAKHACTSEPPTRLAGYSMPLKCIPKLKHPFTWSSETHSSMCSWAMCQSTQLKDLVPLHTTSFTSSCQRAERKYKAQEAMFIPS